MLEVQAQSRWSSVSRGNSPMFTFSDMKGALVFFAVLLSVLSGECVGSAPGGSERTSRVAGQSD